MVIKITVPGDPVAKGRPRFTRTGHSYTPPKTKQFENLVRLAYTLQQPDRDPAEGPIELTVRVYFAIPTSWSKKKQEAAATEQMKKISKPDLDNCLKAVQDGLNGVAWKDDAQVTDTHSSKRYSKRPRVEIEIKTEEERNERTVDQ